MIRMDMGLSSTVKIYIQLSLQAEGEILSVSKYQVLMQAVIIQLQLCLGVEKSRFRNNAQLIKKVQGA